MQDSNDSHYQHGQKQTSTKRRKHVQHQKKKIELKSDPAVKNML